MKVFLISTLLLLTLAPIRAGAQNITAFAGNHEYGFSGDNTSASGARLSTPSSVALDAAGNVFIADYNNHVIRKVNPEGIITTIAGTHVKGYTGDGGPATAAEIGYPWGLVTDNQGNIYFSEPFYNVIRKINAAGTIITYAGIGFPGYSGDGGQAVNARVNHPIGLAIDHAGNLYFADNLNNVIRKISSTGIISTIAGNHIKGFSCDGGPALAASLDNPRCIAIDDQGNIYFSDTWNYVVRKVNTAGKISTVAGNHIKGYSGDGGPANACSLWDPVGVTLVNGELYIADNHNHAIRKISTSGTITTIAGTGKPGYSGNGEAATSAQLCYPTYLAFDGKD